MAKFSCFSNLTIETKHLRSQHLKIKIEKIGSCYQKKLSVSPETTVCLDIFIQQKKTVKKEEEKV